MAGMRALRCALLSAVVMFAAACGGGGGGTAAGTMPVLRTRLASFLPPAFRGCAVTVFSAVAIISFLYKNSLLTEVSS